MTPMTPPPRLQPAPAAAAGAGALSPAQRWTLLVAVLAAIGLGAMLGHGLGRSVAGALAAGWASWQAALTGAAVAAVLAPLSAWVALRIVAPALPVRPRKPGSGVLAAIGLGRPRLSVVPGGSNAAASAGGAPAHAQAPARDALTGAYTQLHFVAAADREWSRIRRHGEDAAMLMIDMDHFKRLNDEHGMDCGDAMLVEITRQASATLRPYDLLARFGGGVLVIYLPHTDPLGALDVAERIRDKVVSLRLNWQGKKVKATVSVGVAGIGVNHAALDAVIADAGAALREAKAAGRNCVRASPIPPRRNPTAARSAG